MKIEDLIIIIEEHLQEVNDNTKERVTRIKNLLDFLNYSLRLTELSEKEKEDFYGSIKGYPLNDNMRKTLEGCPNEEIKDYYITMWARSTYFRRCAWLQYLHGEVNDKQFFRRFLTHIYTSLF